MSNLKQGEFRGNQFAVRLVPRGRNDPHVCIQILTEDDGRWINVGSRFSSFWIDDLIQQLQAAKQAMESLPDDRDGYGKELYRVIRDE